MLKNFQEIPLGGHRFFGTSLVEIVSTSDREEFKTRYWTDLCRKRGTYSAGVGNIHQFNDVAERRIAIIRYNRERCFNPRSRRVL